MTNKYQKNMPKTSTGPGLAALWSYFCDVLGWVKLTFATYRKEMKGLDWGTLYNQFHGAGTDPAELEDEIRELMMDDDVTNNKGVYAYVLTREEKHLSIRAFTDADKRAAYERQHGICPGPGCGKHFEIGEMEADHIDPWSKGGKTIAKNCKMLCAKCNRRKSDV